MLAKNLIAADASNNSIRIAPKAVGWDALILLGSTLPASVKIGELTESITITAPEKGKTGLIALSLTNFTEMETQNRHLFLSVTNADQPYVDLEKPWVPDGNRLGQIATNDFIEVIIDGKVYTSSPWNLDPGDIRVPDGNLLCRYLIGEVEKGAVINAATEEKLTSGEIEEREKNLTEQKTQWHWRANSLRLILEMPWWAWRKKKDLTKKVLWKRPAVIIRKKSKWQKDDCFICGAPNATLEAVCIQTNGHGAFIRCCDKLECQQKAAIHAAESPFAD